MQKILKQLSRFKTVSFAIWPFDPDKDAAKIHTKIVILGLNPSKEVVFGKNFHAKRFDRWYEEGFSRAPFAGALMTDLMSYHEPKSSVVLKKWENAPFRDGHVTALKRQFAIAGVQPSTPILCIGKNTEKLFRVVFPEFQQVQSINHPNSYRMKDSRKKFLRDVRRIGDAMHPRRVV